MLCGSVAQPAAGEEGVPHIEHTTVAAQQEALVELVEGALGENIAFSAVTVARNFVDGVLGLLLGGGMGPIRPNTVVLPFPAGASLADLDESEPEPITDLDASPPGLEDWAGTVRASAALGRTVVATRGFQIGGTTPTRGLFPP